jgi:hypothetical protein
MLTELKLAFPSLPIIIGGQALFHISKKSLEEFPEITYLSDLNQLEDFIANFK